MLLDQTKDAKTVCDIRCQITRTRIHKSLKSLASARHNNGRKSFLPVECTLQTTVTEDEEEDDVINKQLINKLNLLGLNNSLCNWILDFLTGRFQSVHVGHNTSSTTTLSTGAPQGCFCTSTVFAKHLYSVYIFVYL